MSQLANWKCHKVVKAGKILRLPVLAQNEKGESANYYEVTVMDADGAALKIKCAPEMFARKSPEVGDYIVMYEDNYFSWSPAHAFEKGYTRL